MLSSNYLRKTQGVLFCAQSGKNSLEVLRRKLNKVVRCDALMHILKLAADIHLKSTQSVFLGFSRSLLLLKKKQAIFESKFCKNQNPSSIVLFLA